MSESYLERGYLWPIAYGITGGNIADADDLSASAAAKMLQNPPVVARGDVGHYARVLMRNEWRDYCHSARRRTTGSLDYVMSDGHGGKLPPLHERTVDPSPGPEAIIEADYERARLRAIVAGLPKLQRAVVSLSADGLPQARIARKLGVARVTVATTLRRVQDKARKWAQ